MLTNRPFLLSALISLGWMALVMTLLNPVHSSYEEIGIQYRLTGADGLPASYLAHFDHVWHYWISYVVFKAFTVAPSVNWYSVALVSCQWVAGWMIGFSILKRRGLSTGLPVYLLFELFISTPFLLDLSISGTSILLTMAGLLIGWTSSSNRKQMVACITMLVIASMLRIHTVALVLISATPYLLGSIGIRTASRTALAVFVSMLIALGLNKLHVAHYEKNIPGWKEQEQFRQAFFQVGNRPINTELGDSQARETYLFTRSGILWDTTFVHADKMNTLAQLAYQPRSAAIDQNTVIFYWLLKNNRSLIVLCLAICMYASFYNRKKTFLIFSCSAISILLLLSIWNWLKLPKHIIVAVTGVHFLGCLIYFKPPSDPSWIRKSEKIILIILYTLLMLLGIRISYTLNIRHQRISEKWKTILAQTAKHKDHFFVFVGNQMFHQAYPIWQSPAEMRMDNTLSAIRTMLGQHHHNRTYYKAVQKEGSSLSATNVLFVGDEIDLIRSAYPHVKFSEPLPEFRGVTVRKLVNSLKMQD